MRSFGLRLGLGVLVGTSLGLGPVPVSWGVAAAGTGLAAGLALRAPAWAVWVPAGLAWARADRAERERARRVPASPLRADGRLDVLRREGGGVVLGLAGRRALLRDPPPDVPDPGRWFRGAVRLDALSGAADIGGFRAETWAAARGFDARARLSGPVGPARTIPGPGGALRRGAERARAAARERLGSDRGPEGALLAALLVGERDALPAEVTEAFRRAGLAHVLALSGLHLGLLALGAAAALRALRVPAPIGRTVIVGFLVGYVFLAGSRPSLVRAAVAGLTAVLGRGLGRRLDPAGALGGAAAALLLFEPHLLFDPGFRLSFAAASVLAAAASRKGRSRGGSRPVRFLRRLGAGLALSAAISVATMPEVARSFGRVSVWSPVSNLLCAPLVASTLGWGGLAAAWPGPGWPGEAWATAAHRAAGALIGLAGTLGGLPGGALALPVPGPAVAIAAWLGAVLAVSGRRPGPTARAALAIALGSAALELVPPERISVLDVGQGDAILVESRVGAVLIDGGSPGREPPDGAAGALGPGVRRLGRALSRRTRRPLRAVVATHDHADHVGAAARLAAHRDLGALVRPVPGAAPAASGEISRFESATREAGRPVVAPGSPSHPLVLLRGRVRVASPGGAGGADASIDDVNELSLTTAWRVANVSLRTTGDLGAPGEERLLRALPPSARRAIALVAGHHGSRRSSGAEWLAAVDPRLVLFSCGAGNPHGHPHEETLERVRARGAAVLRTDRDGTVTITATPRGFRIRWIRGFPGPRRPFPPIPLCPAGRIP